MFIPKVSTEKPPFTEHTLDDTLAAPKLSVTSFNTGTTVVSCGQSWEPTAVLPCETDTRLFEMSKDASFDVGRAVYFHVHGENGCMLSTRD